ncbi:sensor domain-containing diguanylate cyclase [Spiribacter vilamensis]|uniref:PAS domain S-box-containing protein/diguanylate cyclase (GGDEF)-like protein n=1 Tax=Spiribacter vilamensis TaxID=531306 RepID=A0A4Q8D014_9GAMM|nr:diguanylate cyclase [Spiribacter vilamensis]RZU98613.1 PAS domain S-box-containing protein/diguanylate cyclase (GGDEF)-like protein [Spiribacter vilamensis]TVO60129.1 diguanylate cyclase [Spiribacter vilamensis]
MADQIAQSVIAKLIEQINDAVLVTHTEHHSGGYVIVYANPAFCAMTGYGLDELIGQTPRILQGPATDRSVIHRLDTNLQGGDSFDGTTVNYRKNGEPYIVRWAISPISDDVTGERYYAAVQHEVTREVHTETINRNILESIDEAIIAIDPSGVVTRLNQAAIRILGLDSESVLEGNDWAEWLAPLADARVTAPRDHRVSSESVDLRALIHEVIEKGEPGTATRYALIEVNGRPVNIRLAVTALTTPSGDYLGVLIVIRDRTNQHAFEQALWQAATHDPLTGVYNRKFADDVLAWAVANADRSGEIASLILFDLDYFKAVNDTYGHNVGDEVLKAVTEAAQSCLRSQDYLVRWGGEEFAVILPGTDRDAASAIAERLRTRIAAATEGTDLPKVEVSLGVGEYRNGEGTRPWFRRVDDALYRAKDSGRNRLELTD